MDTANTIRFNALPKTGGYETNLDFWAAYWEISANELNDVIKMLGSASFMKIDGYLKMRRASA